MLIFRKILPILLIAILNAQTKIVVIDKADSLSIENIDSIKEQLSKILMEDDEIADYFILDNIKDVFNYSRINQRIEIDTLLLKSSDIKYKVFLKMFDSMLGTKPLQQSNKQFSRIIKSNSAFTDSSSIQYGLYNTDDIGAVIALKTNFNNYFSGLFGASRKDKEWLLNGQIDIHLENQWGTANILDLHWKRIDEESQTLNLLVEEPHPFNLPIGFSIMYDQDLRDGNYLNNRSSVGIIKNIPGIAKFGFGGRSVEINSTERGDSLGIESLTAKSVYLNSMIDQRNDYWIPNQGHLLSLAAELGSREINSRKNSILSLQAVIQKYFGIYRNVDILLKLNGKGTWVKDGSVHIGEKVRYGGINTLRGYTEDIFMSDWVIIPTIEIGNNVGSRTKLSLFSDIAIQKEYKSLLFGIGLGFTQVSKNSVLKLYYALGKDDKLKSGKIHIQFLSLL